MKEGKRSTQRHWWVGFQHKQLESTSTWEAYLRVNPRGKEAGTHQFHHWLRAASGGLDSLWHTSPAAPSAKESLRQRVLDPTSKKSLARRVTSRLMSREPTVSAISQCLKYLTMTWFGIHARNASLLRLNLLPQCGVPSIPPVNSLSSQLALPDAQ